MEGVPLISCDVRDVPPVEIQSDQQREFNRLMTCLNRNEEEFLQGIEIIKQIEPEKLPGLFDEIYKGTVEDSLLTLACKKGSLAAVKRMLELGANVITDGDSRNPIKWACYPGDWGLLKLLLEQPKLDLKNAGPLISIIVQRFGYETTEDKFNYKKCFKMLMNREEIDINQQDEFGCSALHYAVRYNHTDATLDLLKKGALIGVKNKFNQLAISNINPKVLEKHFDSCITRKVIPAIRTGKDIVQMEFDYTNLVKQNVLSAEEGEDAMEVFPDEMSAIEYIAESKKLRHLVGHPLIASFLSLKWNRLDFIFYANFFLFALLALSTVSYILFCYKENPNSQALKNFLRVMTIVLTFYVAWREISKFILSPKVYLRCWDNYLEWALIVLRVLILFDICSDSWRRTVAATSILLIAMEIFLLAGSLPFWSFSTHYVMLKTVTWSFLRSLSLYVIILLAFALSFFTLLRPETSTTAQPNHSPQNDQSTKSNGTDVELNNFRNLGLSIMKTIIMSTGEFDAADINFNLNLLSYFIFIAFLFIIPIVLLNLLIGLAISDIILIRSEAELSTYIRRCQVLARHANTILDRSPLFRCSNSKKNSAQDKNSVFKVLLRGPVLQIKMNENLQCVECHHLSCFGRCKRLVQQIREQRQFYGVTCQCHIEKQIVEQAVCLLEKGGM